MHPIISVPDVEFCRVLRIISIILVISVLEHTIKSALRVFIFYKFFFLSVKIRS